MMQTLCVCVRVCVCVCVYVCAHEADAAGACESVQVASYVCCIRQEQRTVCRFGTECRNPKCKFTHPPGVGEVR